MTVNPRQSFRLKLCLWIFIVSVFVFTTVFGATLFYVGLETRRNINMIVDAKFDFVTHAIERNLNDAEVSANNLMTIGQSPLLTNKRDSVYSLCKYFLKYNPKIQGVAIGYSPSATPDREQGYAPYVVNSGGEFKTLDMALVRDYREVDWYKKTMETGLPNWSAPFHNLDGKVTVCYNMPIRDKNGKPYAVQSVDMSLEDLDDSIQSLAPYPHSIITVIDENGTYVAHPNKAYIVNESMQSIAAKLGLPRNEEIAAGILSRQRGYGKFYNGEEDVYVYYAPVKKNNWTVTLEVPYSDLAGGYSRMFKTMLIHSLLGVVMLLIVCVVIVRKLTKPLEQFSLAARKISHGEFHVELPVIKDHNELYDLRQALAAMEISLDSYIDDLKKTTESKAIIESELKTASHIQMSMVPKIFPPYPERSDIDVFASLIPAKAVGGDLYDFLLDGDDLYFCIGDVSGKGIPASLFMAITRSLFRNICSQATSPAKIANTLNRAITEGNEENMFVTMFIGKCNLKTGAFTCCNCGHNAPVTNGVLSDAKNIVVSPGPTPSFINALPTNLPIGVIADFDYKEVSMTIEKGVKIFLYTDGVTEAENDKRELFGDNRLIEVLAATGGEHSAQDYVEHVRAEVHSFVCGAEQSDDLTMLCFNYLGPTETN